MKVLFVVVLYKTPPGESRTIVSLASNDYSALGIDPVFSIWDNSSDGFGDVSLGMLPGEIKYYHEGVNAPLSAIYNKVILSSTDCSWVVLLDDDSCVTSSYINSLPVFFKSGISLAIPKIELKGRLISPGKIVGVRGRKLKSSDLKVGSFPSKSLTAMMSGTVVGMSAFIGGLRFDERLRFYGVDTRFFMDYATRYSEVFILDVSMSHDSALRDNSLSVSEQISRHLRLIESWPVVFSEKILIKPRLLLYLFYYVTKLALVRRNINFFSLLPAGYKVIKDYAK